MGWTTLIDANEGLDNFNQVGEANWTATDQGIQATQTDNDPSYLVSKDAYGDFMLRVEFWASMPSPDAKSRTFANSLSRLRAMLPSRRLMRGQRIKTRFLRYSRRGA
jgi:hypothetical protein